MAVPKLYVEGKDDCHVIVQLLRRHGVELVVQPDPSSKYPVITHTTSKTDTPSIEEFLRGVPDRVRISERPVGFVVDADLVTGVAGRWEGLSRRLRESGVECPAAAPAEGFVGYSETYKVKVGAWLMPDNQRDGTLEHFLRDLIEKQDKLITHAEASVESARLLDARFTAAAAPKALLHTWLAWQREPGCPYGQAIAACYFKSDSEAALAFVAWFKRLFEESNEAA